MTPDLKRRWLEALRSGKYKKARSELIRHNNNGTAIGHCCLGVLTEIEDLGPSYDYASVLNLHQLRMAGMSGSQQSDLTKLNDQTGGWDKVCDYIEKNL